MISQPYKGNKKIAAHVRDVGVISIETTGFEPATSCSRSKRSTKLSHVSSAILLIWGKH